MEGDNVMLYFNDRYYLVTRAHRGREVHTRKGVIDLESLVGREFGEALKTSMGEGFKLLRPTLRDLIGKFRRVTQVIYPKDIALIIVLAGIGPGSVVIEGGAGSGVLTSFLAHYVRPNGLVYSYEVRGEYLDVVRKNLELAGLLRHVVLKHKDITLGIDERDVDAVVLDISMPWSVVPHAVDALKPGGFFVSFSPAINQAERTVMALRAWGFFEIEVLESLVRKYKVHSGETRPLTKMMGHTGFITLARRA